MKVNVLLIGAAMAAMAGGAGAAELPPLFGDGVHDDTAAIQARLDAGKGLVQLPPPAKEYLISTTLVIRSSTELRLDRFTRVRLAPQSDCSMLTNARWTEGDRGIAVSGGVWDFDNVNQPANRWSEGEVRGLRERIRQPLAACSVK